MRKGFQTILLVAILVSNSCFAISAGFVPQEIRLATPAPVTKTFATLEATEAETLQSILWLHAGRSVSKVEVKALESETRNHPDEVEPRLRLIGYYTWRSQGKADQNRLRGHVLWMIENHPEHPATAEPALRDLPDDPEGNIRIHELWTNNIERRGEDYRVLRNAEKFFFGEDPEEAERIIYHLHEKAPANREWPDELTALYITSGVPGFAADTSDKVAEEAYRRVLSLTTELRVRDTLAENMAEKYFRAGDFRGAGALARISLQSSDGGVIRRANTLLGRIALRSGDITGARRYLLESEKRKHSRHGFESIPSMALAKELLENEERDIVVEYLEDCVALWPQLGDVLHSWIAVIKKGKIPNFGNTAL
jgi:hypothetical protein